MTERPAFDPADVTPERFAQLVTGASDEDIVETIRSVGTRAVLDRVFAGMQERFLAQVADGAEGEIRFVVTDGSEEHSYTATLRGGGCTIERAEPERPRFMIRTDLANFCRLIAGCANRPMLLFRGKLKVSGDLMFGLRIESFFDHI